MGKVKITQVKSTIDRPKRQKLTMESLGIRKMHQTVVHEATPQILGMIAKVQHLVVVENA
ncbi:MAG: 50S ribosomal protein L30 [Saprospiraceae bacterium]|jgi:large subunit ribosomal protein L30|nr:50S ribosomal protein L30 [Saprospiraceae bacterium]